MRKILLVLITALIATGCTTTVTVDNSQKETNSTVTDVVDGDTVDIRLDGNTETVRLIGVDTPEVHVENSPEEFEKIPDNERGRQCLKKWGEKASEYAKTRLSNRKINFETDPQTDTRGSYGRLLGYIKINGTNFNYRLVEKGLGRVYDSEFSQKQRFLEAENTAQKQLKGLWQCRTYEIENITTE